MTDDHDIRHIPKASDQDFYHKSLNPAACALKTVAMNANYRGMSQYPDEYNSYGQTGNNMQPVGFHQGSYDNANMALMNPMGGGGAGGYPMAGYDSSQSHMMMAGQGQMSAHPALYQQQAAYLAQQQQQQQQQQQHQQQQQQQQQHQQQYYSSGGNSSGGGGGSSGGQYAGQTYPVQGAGSLPPAAAAAAVGGSSPYYNTGSGQQSQGGAGVRMVPPPHHHLRNTSGQQNPQQVADNILQMASSYPIHHTVQVPLKNRHAPYQIPHSPQNYYAEKCGGQQQQQGMSGQGPQQTMHAAQAMMGQQAMGGGQMQTKSSQPQGQMCQSSNMAHSPAMMYAGSSPHSQMQQNSPSSPLMMQSPAAAHQSQSLSSPGALNSPSSVAVCSPVPSSPGLAGMRSPSSMPMRSPAHLSSGYLSQPISSPPQRSFATSDSSAGAQHCSPTSMHSPASHTSSPYAPPGMAHIVNSPPQQPQSYSSPNQSSYKMNMLMDSGQGPGSQRVQSTQGQSSDPLQSLQKLVMLPETQVVDPKSVVNDGCLQNSEDGSKNFEGPAEQSREAVDCSAGVSVNTCSPPTIEGPNSSDNPPQEIGCENKDPVSSNESIDVGGNEAEQLQATFSTSDTALASAPDALDSVGITNHYTLSGDEEDSFSSELDFGYDSPPFEMQDDSWRPEVEKCDPANSDDEADGIGDYAQNDSVPKTSKSSQGATKSSLSPVAPLGVTRTVTRSFTGRMPAKRRSEEMEYPTSYKRTRRSSAVSEQQNCMSLSMECDEIDTKRNVSDVEVISSGDESHSGPNAHVQSNPSAFTAAYNDKNKKAPGMLNKLSKKKAKKGGAQNLNFMLSSNVHNNFYSVRGAGDVLSASKKDEVRPSYLPDRKAAPKRDEVRPASKQKTKKKVKGKSKKNQFCELDSIDDSFKSMKFSKTLDHLQHSKKDKSQSGKVFTPFVRVQGKHSEPSFVSVFNTPPIEGKHAKSTHKTKGISSATTTMQITNFSSDKSVMLPWTKTTEALWVCALCGKRSSYRFLGDLFGPYFLESHLSSLTKGAADGGKKDSRPDSGGTSEVQNPHNTRRRSLSQNRTTSTEESTSPPPEIWVHEDCVLWSTGVYVVGSRMYGLEEALNATTSTMCACCQEKGALIGCLHKGCNQNFHYLCAVDKTCYLDVENFSMLCPKHKDKKMKCVGASTSKS
ncbi:hypothetical protein ACOMHN_049474 [Nucella lapillus]